MIDKRILVTILILPCLTLLFPLSLAKASGTQVYWGGYFGGSDGTTVNENRMPLSVVQTFGNEVGKQPSIWNWLEWWANNEDAYHSKYFQLTWMNEARDNGMIPMISWGTGTWYNGVFYGASYSDILNGKYDSYIAQWGQASAQWGHPYFIRLNWEFGLDSQFVTAWKYIVNHFRSAEYAAEGNGENIDYVSWVWCPLASGDSANTLRDYYPSGTDAQGKSYVDWVGTDIYDFMGKGNDIETQSIRTIAPDKSFMFAEFGTNDMAWASNYFQRIQSGDLSSFVKAVVLWIGPDDVFAASSAFKQVIQSNYYATNTFDSISQTPIPPDDQQIETTPTLLSTNNNPASDNSEILLLTIIVSFSLTFSMYFFIKLKKATRKQRR